MAMKNIARGLPNQRERPTRYKNLKKISKDQKIELTVQ